MEGGCRCGVGEALLRPMGRAPAALRGAAAARRCSARRGGRRAGRPRWLGALAVAATVASLLAAPAAGCHIQGTDSGVCEDIEDFELKMPFCSSVVQYRACVPRFQELFSNHTVRAKDDWVARNHKAIVDFRKEVETDEELEDLGITETGEEGDIVVRFFENPDCESAYKNLFCWMNFPRCDEEDQSLIMCRSICENFFDACEYDSDLWRCGDPQFYGGEEPEADDVLDDDGLPIYWRAMLPGQPFRDNEFDEEDNPIPVCTPSIKNAAARGGGGAALGALALASVAAAVALASSAATAA